MLVYGPHPSNPNFLTENHPLRGLHGSHFVADKLDVEQQVRRFARQEPQCRVTVLRLADVLGPTADSYVARWLSRRFVPTAVGHDPLLQFVHEADAVAALKLALDTDVAGIFNVVGDGVVPISTLIKIAGRLSVPIPYPLLRKLAAILWVAQLSEEPPPSPRCCATCAWRMATARADCSGFDRCIRAVTRSSTSRARCA